MRLHLILVVLLFSLTELIYSQGLTDCKSCDTYLIEKQDIDTLSIDELQLLVNEIYARNGYVFSTDKYNYYFRDRSWYSPKSSNSLVKLNSIEVKNVDLMKKRIDYLRKQRSVVLDYVQNMQQYARGNNDAALQRIFDGTDYYRESSISDLKEVLLRLDPEDINWYKNYGLYKIERDNGFVIEVYELRIERDAFYLMKNYMAHSEIIAEFDIFSDYDSISEYCVKWCFRVKDLKVVFDRIWIAG